MYGSVQQRQPSRLGRVLVIAVLAIVAVVLLFLVWAFNRIERIDDANEMMRILRQQRPNITAYAVTYDQQRSVAVNVLLDQHGRALVRDNDRVPVMTSGAYYRFEPHGTVEYADDGDGYTVTGITSKRIVCPNGYSGRDCKPSPLCVAGDAGKVKPITYAQFNALRLYEASALSEQLRTRRRKRDTDNGDDDGALPYRRIRVHCLDNSGSYRLEACPRNQLLDEKLVCRAYDVCTDSVDGYRHNYPIGGGDEPGGSEELQANEYYVCRDGHSVRTRCTEKDSVWVDRDKMCELSNVCTNRDDDVTLPDTTDPKNSYLLCERGQPRRVTCQNGVTEIDGRLVCRPQTCVPRVDRYRDDHLSYATGAIECKAPNPRAFPLPHEIVCTTRQTDRKFRFDWRTTDANRSLTFDAVLHNWPDRIYDETSKACRTPTDNDDDLRSILYNPVLDLRYTDLMPQAHPFDLLKRRFVCAATDKWYWDYAGTGQLVPPNDGTFGRDYFAETAIPCHQQLQPGNSAPWYPVRVTTDGVPPFLAYGYNEYPIDDETIWPTYPQQRNGNWNAVRRATFWPYVLLPWDSQGHSNKRPDPSQILVYTPRVDYDTAKRSVIVTVNRSKGIGPPGFRYDADATIEYYSRFPSAVTDVCDARLTLNGYGVPDEALLDANLWFTIGSGKFEQGVLPPEHEQVYEKSYSWPQNPMIDELVTDQTIEYGVCWPLVPDQGAINIFANVYLDKSVGVYATVTDDDGNETRSMLDQPVFSRLRFTRQDPGPDPDYPTLAGDALVAVIGFNVLVRYGRGSTLVTGQQLPLEFNIP